MDDRKRNKLEANRPSKQNANLIVEFLSTCLRLVQLEAYTLFAFDAMIACLPTQLEMCTPENGSEKNGKTLVVMSLSSVFRLIM